MSYQHYSIEQHLFEERAKRARNIVGGALAAGAAMYGYKRQRTSQDTTGSTLTQATSALESIHGHHELVTRKRETPSTYRLHGAKYLVMDKMLKNLFFPLNTTMLRFGISSFTGANLSNITDTQIGGENQTSDRMRPRGLYRGLVMFDVRNTDFNVDRTTTNALNCKYINVGGVSASSNSGDITSVYRRFHSRPGQSGASDAGPIINEQPTLTDAENVTSGNLIRSLSLGTNLNDIEESATAGMCYQDPYVALFKNRDNYLAAGPGTPGAGNFVDNQESLNTGLNADQDPATQGGNVEGDDITWTGPDKQHYWKRFKDAVVRLPDGSVELDIMNTEHSPCVVEIVVHSRKGQFNRGKQDVYRQLWQDVESHLVAKNQLNVVDETANPVGGWQAFFDPSYPLLKIPSKGEVNRYINEVHRSNHVLAPGQSKKVKINLGHLYYKIGNKMDKPLAQSSFDKGINNNGTLYFSIGHSGFEYPQSMVSLKNSDTVGVWTTPSSTATGSLPFGNVAGTGFWVGKANAPSSISIDGCYTDKFYPVTFDRTPANIYDAGFPRVAGYIKSGTSNVSAIPLATIVPQRVATGEESVIQEL